MNLRQFLNPFAGQKVKLTPGKVPVSFKQWAVQEMNADKTKGAIIARDYGLSGDCVRGWKKKHNKGAVLCGGSGRSTKFSKNALKKVQDAMQEGVFDVRSTEYEDLLKTAAHTL